ncbi:hypothetical protein BDZ89DRAFT_305135 [Hymenopellis radicata]|nr:hypothetical protein BDZ89DRAFT_305135 [Hymenopellis radicata]
MTSLGGFFSSPDPTRAISIFLIARSNCAFVNFATEADLQRAISTYNKVPLRPTDPQCPMLVCRVRKKDDDLTAGVGGQRGTGMHTRWVRTQKAKERELEEALGGLSIVDGREVRPPSKPHPDSTSSDSFSSTKSSMLSQYFPKRYFILKSHTQEDLDRSVQTGLWTTQRHNEGVLDQAYRSSKDGVYLIFSVNKSGEFYGYARMAGPIGEEHEPPPTEPAPPVTGQTHASSFRNPTAGDGYFANRLVEESPMPLQTPEQMRTAITEGAARYQPNLKSAPPELGAPHHGITPVTPAAKFSLDARASNERPPPRSQQPTMDTFHSPHDPKFKLDEAAPSRALRSPGRDPLQMVSEDSEDHQETLGRPFRVEWLCTERLSFHLTRHLRNEWNKDKEVKVSRDGTEIEPTVGERWIAEWTQMLIDAKEKTLTGDNRAREGRGRKAGKERVKEGGVPPSFG